MNYKFVFFLVTFLLSSASFGQGDEVFGQDDEELLPPEVAFAFSSELVGNELVATWDIVDGYYMYQNKFWVNSLTEDVTVGELETSPGKEKDDPFFGKVVVYTEKAQVRVPLFAKNNQVTGVELEVWGQGCNEPIGICFPPQSNIVSLPMALIPAAEAAQTSEVPVSDTNALSSLFSEIPSVTAETLLDVDEAFVLDVWSADGERLKALFEVQPGYYIYKDKLKFEPSDQARLMPAILPEGEVMDDPYFGVTAIYTGNFEFEIPLIRASPEFDVLELTAEYQGCAKDLICYPPVQKTFKIPLMSLVSTALADTGGAGSGGFGSRGSGAIEQSFWWLIITAFGTGFLLTFTPCVLPLIPILSSIIVGEGETQSRMRTGTLSVTYVLGTLVAYAIVGAVAGSTGEQLQAYLQNAWAIGAMTVIFVLMALSLFGFYEIRMPSSLEASLQSGTLRLGGGKFGAVFALGLLSALIVSACVSPLLISLLGIAVAKADPVLGAAMMTSMALGMGVILIAIGFGLALALPKAGTWMDRLKQGFGVVLLGVAIYILGSIPEIPVLILWALLLIIAGVYLGATQELKANASGWAYFWKGSGLVMLIWGILALIGGVMGNRNILQPLSSLSGIG